MFQTNKTVNITYNQSPALNNISYQPIDAGNENAFFSCVCKYFPSQCRSVWSRTSLCRFEFSDSFVYEYISSAKRCLHFFPSRLMSRFRDLSVHSLRSFSRDDRNAGLISGGHQVQQQINILPCPPMAKKTISYTGVTHNRSKHNTLNAGLREYT